MKKVDKNAEIIGQSALTIQQCYVATGVIDVAMKRVLL